MYVGILQIELELPGTRCLKDKRRILKGLESRLRRRFEAAVATVGPVENWHEATLGVALVSNDPVHVRQRADAIIRFVEAHPEAVLGDFQTEIL